jgi:predicted nucleic-acid-binding protein
VIAVDFIDSNIIAYSFYDNPRKDVCRKAIFDGGITDSVALIEAFNIIEYQTDREHATDCIKSLLKSNLSIISTDINVIFETLKRTKTKLRFIDLIHFTSASISNCSYIVSYDKDFNNLEIKRKEPKKS